MCNTITCFCTLIVVGLFGLIFILVYLTSPLANMPDFRIYSDSINYESAKLKFAFDKFVNQKWTNDLWHHLVYEKVENDYTNFTKNAAICRAICNADGTGGTIFYEKNCNTFPLLLKDNDPEIKNYEIISKSRSRMVYALSTMPCFVTLDQSTIPGAGRGVFTSQYNLPKGLILARYKGNVFKAYGKEGEIGRKSAYAWQIWNAEHKSMVYIDGRDDTKSNWIRYINSARFYEEQNVVPIIFNNSVYYMTFKDVEANTELLVWYGQTFAKTLLTRLTKNSKHNWHYFFAPPVNETICPTCPTTEGEERALDFDYNYYDYLFEFFYKCCFLLTYFLFMLLCYVVTITR